MKLLRIIVLCCCLGGFADTVAAQGYAFGLKFGPTIGLQSWDGFEQDPLFAYHGILFIETAPENNSGALFAQVGYHIRGSAFRNQLAVNFNNNQIERQPPTEFEFRNIALTAGFKQKYDLGLYSKAYYALGIRGEYTVNTNLEQYEFFARSLNTLIFPIDGFVQRWNYGAYLGGGVEFPFGELIAGIAELSINPDFSLQYRQPAIRGVRSPFTGNNTTIGERLIRNISIELTVGIRFLNKVVYVD